MLMFASGYLVSDATNHYDTEMARRRQSAAPADRVCPKCGGHMTRIENGFISKPGDRRRLLSAHFFACDACEHCEA